VEHRTAVGSYAAERYLLGELVAEERDRFEEHFFACAACAAAVRDLVRLRAGVAALTPSRTPSRSAPGAWTQPGWWNGLLTFWPAPRYAPAFTAALLGLAITLGYKAGMVHSRVQPQVLQSFALRPETRGEPTAIGPRAAGPLLLLQADPPSGMGPVQWEIRRAGSDAAVMRGAAPAPPPGNPFQLLLPTAPLPAGRYRLIIRAGTAGHAQTYRFIMGAPGRSTDIGQ
jgi:hypothetical protein